jgi:hypothetical protein
MKGVIIDYGLATDDAGHNTPKRFEFLKASHEEWVTNAQVHGHVADQCTRIGILVFLVGRIAFLYRHHIELMLDGITLRHR